MKRNPFLKAEEKIIRRVYGNTATLTYHVKSRTYNSETGELSETDTVFTRAIHIGKISEFADALVDGENIKKGDLRCDVARKTLVDALNPKIGDPAALSGLRSASVINAGIDISSDRLTCCGRTYAIRKIIPCNVYADEPSVYTLHLREVS